MEQFITKNKIFNSILEPVVTYLQKTNFNTHSNAIDTLGCTIENLWKSEINGIESVDKNTTNIVDTFFDAYKSIQATDNPSAVQWRQFVITLHDTLSKIDDFKISLIEQSLTKSQAQLETLENKVFSEYIKTWFKAFCKNICDSMALMQKRAVEIESDIVRNHLYLHIIQLTTCLRLMFNLLCKELSNKLLIMESRRFLIKRFIYCFDGIKKCLNDDICQEPSPGFIQWMDTALSLVSAMDASEYVTENMEKTKSGIEEVLCHAMSIAQISSAEDCKKIKAGIQSVLHELNQLNSEYTKLEQNPSLCNLYIDLVSDKLCSLERKVNTAVLNISLQVFSTLIAPLKKLQQVCEDAETSILNRSEDDLDELVTALDMHVDCLIQVGLFAIACSTNTNIVSKIRSNLASLESLESELVPALTSLYMEPSTVACLHANLFIEHWQQEVRKLKNSVCFIIDPVAFGQVVYEDYKISLESFSQLMTDIEFVFTKDRLLPICDRIEIFIIVARASIQDMRLTLDCLISRQCNKLVEVFIELSAAINQLSDNSDRQYSKRVLKRLNVLKTMLKRSIQSFSIDDSNVPTALTHQESSKSISKKSQIRTILYEESIKDLQNRGQQLLKDRSILYKTPKQNSKVLPTPNKMSTVKYSEKRKMRLSFVRMVQRPTSEHGTNINNSLDLQITQILENLSGLTVVD
ncbi:Spitting Image [Carabus blaptoides fortunei]